MRVALINPPQPSENLRSTFGKTSGFILPYNLLSLASYLKYHGVEADIFDCVAEGISLEDLAALFQQRSYDLAGVTSFTFNAAQAFNAVETIKKYSPATFTVMGGIHASVLPLETLEECPFLDFTAVGEGENTILALANQLAKNEDVHDIPNIGYRRNGEPTLTSHEPCFVDPNAMPIPDYSMLKMDLYKPHTGNYKVLPTFSFYASRGCPFQCSFCSANIVLGRKIRYKSIDLAMKEIQILVNDYGTRGLFLQDSTFTVNKKWVYEFCSRLIAERMTLVWRANTRVDCIDDELLTVLKKAGCYRINLGFESGNQETLDLLKKGTTVEQNVNAARMVQRAGLELGASFIIGLPNEGMDEVMQTIEFAKRIGARYTQFYLPIPYPGTALRELCAEGTRKNAIWHDYSSRDFSNAVYINPRFGPDLFRGLPDLAYREYYCNLRAVKRILLSIRSRQELKDAIGIFKKIYAWKFH
ncbi:MAG: radical SAM protein [bacterium]